MSDSSNSNKYYVPTPIAADYEAANSDIISRASNFGVKSHRLLSAKGDKANQLDKGATNFRFLEDSLFSNRFVKLSKISAPSMFEDDYIQKVKNLEGCTYKVLRFDRSHNIRTFDFIITYTQLNSFGAETFKPILMHKQFKGSLLFTGCSIVRDTDTMEELPLKLYGKYESIGDNVYNSMDVDGNENAKGGPTLKVKYTFDNKYIYLFLSSVSPFRLIPTGDGEFIDISYAEGKGTLVGETKDNINLIANPITGSKKTVSFIADNRIWCDVNLSLTDTTISHDVNNAEFVNYDEEVMNKLAVNLREQEIIFAPTNDGEQVVINMEPSSMVNLEIAPDIKPIRFGCNLLKSSKDKINDYIDKLKNRIIECGTNIEKVPFSIKTSIRTKGKYNVNGDFFIDSQSDSFGSILINDVGVYDTITGKFDITEYIFDKNQTKYSKLDNVKNYNDYKDNASTYLSEISNGTKYKSVRKTEKLLDVLSNIEFENPNELEVYFNVAFVKNTLGFNVLAAFAEFGEDDATNSEDYIVYICADNKIRIINFKDYDMENIKTIDLSNYSEKFSNSNNLTKIDRCEVDGEHKYYLGTDNGLVIILSEIISENPIVKIIGAFDAKCNSIEEVTLIDTDNLYVYVGGANGNVSIITTRTNGIKYLPTNFRYNDTVIAAKIIDEDHIMFISKTELCSFCVSSNKWNNENDLYRSGALFDNPYTDIPNPNIDYIIDKNGWIDVPVIQKGNFAYALGNRFDRESGYANVYKKMNVLTGEVTELDLPDLDYRVYKGKLCVDGQYIYSIGGKSISTMNDELSTRTKTYISVFDTVSEKWIKHNTVELGDGIVLDDSDGFYPVANNGKIYVIHPKTTRIFVNENTGNYTSEVKRFYKSYKIDINESTVDQLSAEINNKFVQLDINIVPIVANENEIHFFSGHPDTTDNKFKGYFFEKYIFYPKTETIVLKNSKVGTEYELVHNYDEGRWSNAPSDLFGNISIYNEGNEAMVLLLERYCLYIYSIGESFLHCEMHAIYHNIADNTKFSYLPLVSSGEYSAWKKYNKTKPSNINLIKNGNYVYFIGGEADRVADVLSLDYISLIPAPRFYERLKGVPESAVLANSKDILKPIAIEDNFTYDEMSSVQIGNDMYLLAVNTASSKYSCKLMKYNLDNAAAKVEIVADLTNQFNSGEYRKWSKFNLTYVQDTDIIVISSVHSVTDDGNVIGEFTAVGYDIESHRISKIVTPTDTFVNSNVIYAFSYAKNNVAFVNDKNIGINIEILGKVVVNVSNINTVSMKPKFKNLTGITAGGTKIVKSVNVGNKVNFVVPKTTGVDLEEFDTHTGEIKVIKTIPSSINYEYPDIFVRNDDVYITKGINGTDIGIDIYCINDGEMKHALLGSPSCGIIAPIAVSKKNNLYVFGIGRTSNSILRVLKSKINENTFINYNTIIDINSAEKSEYNRYSPNYTTTKINGHELLLVFGGTQSISTTTTNTIDIFDVNKHMWSQPVELPAKLSHISIVENEIIGATEEIVSNGTKVAYPKKLTLTCVDYNSLRFEIIETPYPTISGFEYPAFAKYAYSKKSKCVYIIDLLENGCIRNGAGDRGIYKVDTVRANYVKLANLPEIVYNETTYVIGSFVVEDTVVVATYSFTTNTVNVYGLDESIGIWSEIKKVNLPFTVKKDASNARGIVATLSSFNNIFNAIKNDTTKADHTVGIISLMKNEEVYCIYISYKTNILVSNVVKVHEFPTGSDIDRCYVSSEGFVYGSDSKNNKTYRCYPNNDEKGFGIRSINAIDTYDHDVISRCVRGNEVLSVYEDCTASITNIVTGVIKRFDIIDRSKYQDYETYKFNLYSDHVSVINNPDGIVGHLFISMNDENDTPVKNTFWKFVFKDGTITTTEIVSDVITDETPIYVRTTADGKSLVLINDKVYLIDSDKSELVETYDPLVNYTLFPLEVQEDKLISLGVENNAKDVILVKGNEIVKIINSFSSTPSRLFIEGTSLYKVESKGNVYKFSFDLNSLNFTDCGYVAKIDIEGTVDYTNIAFGTNSIIDLSRGIEISIANSIDNDHYCFNESAINYNNDKIITIIKSNDESYICVHDFNTHKMINKCLISDSYELPEESSSFICKNNNVLKYCIVLEGKLQIIDASTGNVSVIEDNNISSSKVINYIPSKNYYIIGTTTDSILVFDPNSAEIKTLNLNYDNYRGYELKEVLFATKYCEYMYALFTKDNCTYLGKIFKSSKVIYMSKTSISETVEFVQKMNSGFLAKGVSGTWYTFKVDEVNSSVSILSKSQYEHFEKKTVDSNALIDFNTVLVEQTEITYEDAAYVEEKKFGNYAIAYCDYDGNNRFVVTNRITNKSFIVPTDIEFVRFEFADIGPLYDDVIDGGITRIGNIVGVINDPVEGKVIRSYSIKVPDVNGEIKTYDDCVDIEGISLIANDSNADHPVIVGDNFSIINLQNRFIGIINDEKIYMYSLSAAWRLIKNDVGIDLTAPITDSKFTTIVVGDLIYIINPDHKRTVAMCVPYEGNLVNILDGKNFKEVAIDDNFYNIINTIIPYSSAFFAENDRICKINDIGIYFNTLYNCSEYYNKFVGVDGSGEVIDNIVPISEYDISYITVSDETNQATLRSNENVKTTIRMIYKSTKNLVSEITAISRLNTAKFKVLYSKTNDDEIGNIYSFLDTEINGQLVRDDTSYYRGDYSVVVVNNSIIKINVDGEIYTYLRADNEIPLYNIILPLVIVYGERENKQGNLEARYLSFVDIKGNLITYDKELKSFIDISGYVDIEIPFFSTEAMIYPSKSNLMTDKDALVEMKVKSTE